MKVSSVDICKIRQAIIRSIIFAGLSDRLKSNLGKRGERESFIRRGLEKEFTADNQNLIKYSLRELTSILQEDENVLKKFNSAKSKDAVAVIANSFIKNKSVQKSSFAILELTLEKASNPKLNLNPLVAHLVQWKDEILNEPEVNVSKCGEAFLKSDANGAGILQV